MSTWDEKVKPTPPLPHARGSTSSRPTASAPVVAVKPVCAHAMRAVAPARPDQSSMTARFWQQPVNGILARGLFDMAASSFKAFLRYIANGQASPLELETQFANPKNRPSWLSLMIDLKKQRDLFATRVIEAGK